ncbi:MAG: VOC family protein, partial [Pseudomonadota bacterium]
DLDHGAIQVFDIPIINWVAEAQSTNTYQNFLAGGAIAIGDPELVQLSFRNPVYYGYVEDLDGAVIEIEHVDVEKLNLPEPPQNQYRIRHVALASPDVERIAEFYSKFLDQPDPRRVGGSGGFGGARIDAVSGLEGSKIKMAWFQIRNLELEISQYVSHPTEVPATPRSIDATGYNVIVLDVEDLDAAQAKFTEAGGTIVTEPEAMDGGQIVFGRDPDGNLIGLQVAPAESVVSAKNFSGNGT